MRGPGLVLLLALWAGGARGATLQLEEEPVVLGRTRAVGITLRVDEPEGEEPRPLRLAVNVGSFEPVARLAPGLYRTVYTPPSTRFPQVALVALWRETGPSAPIEFLRIPLYGTTRVPVRAQPGSEASVSVGDKRFGPVEVGPSGRASLSADIPPDVREVRVHVRQHNGASATRALPVRVPPYNRLTAAVVPHALLADGRSWARVDVFHDAGGAELPASAVRLVPSVGTATRVHAGRGRYVFRYQPPVGTQASEVDFQVRVEGDAHARASARLKLGLPPPALALLRAPEAQLTADGHSSVDFTLLVVDGTGLGLPGQRVEVLANGQPLAGVRDEGEGLYRVPFTAPARLPPGGLVRLEATVRGSAGPPVHATLHYALRTAPVPAQVRGQLVPALVPADGTTRARLTLDVRDAAGLPLEGAQLILVASHGTVGPLAPLEGGRYQATYVGPEGLSEGPVELRVVDTSGDFEARLPVPLRAAPHRLLVGGRAGFVHSLARQYGARVGLDVWAPLRLGGGWWGVGLTVSASRVRQQVADAQGTLTSDSEALFFPVALRLGGELYASRRGSVVLGAGPCATLARFSTSLTSTRRDALGLGAQGFVGLSHEVGPGQLFGELSYTFAPVGTEGFQLDAGGPGLAVGYRFGVL